MRRCFSLLFSVLGFACLHLAFDSASTFIPSAYSAPESNDSRARSLIAYLKKHESVIKKSGEDHYYRQVLWALIAIDFKTLSGPMKRELLSLLFNWIGGSLSESDALEIKEALKKKGLGADLDEFFSPLRLAVLKEVDARDLPRSLRDALKKAFTRLQMDKAGLKRLEIFDKDEERFVNEMLVAGLLPSTASPEALLGSNLITNLTGNLISGNFSSGDLVTQAKAVSQALGISEDTTGKLLQVAVNDKLVQKVIGASKIQSVQDRLAAVRSGLESGSTSSRIEPSQNQQELQALFDKANIKPDLKVQAPTHRTPKLEERRKVPIKTSESQGTRISSPSVASTQTTTRTTLPSDNTAKPTSASLPTPKPPDPKIEAARELVDPRELLGGSYVLRNPNYTTTDPLLQDKKHIALGDYGSKYFKEAQEASIRAGSKIGDCDVKEIRSDKLCESEKCKKSKPCECYKGMLETVLDFEMRPAGKDKAASEAAASDVVTSRIQETGATVEASVRLALQKKYNEIRQKLKDPKLSEEKRKELLEGAANVEELEKREAVERSFYIKKVLLNGVMNTKTPACVLKKGRYGIGAKRDPATEPEWIVPNENYCHQFDIEPHEPFVFDPQKPGKGLSQQDSILLRLALRTLDGLEESNPKQLSKDEILGGYESMGLKTSETQVCTSRSLCTLPDAVSEKPVLYRIFADEAKDVRTRKLFDGETDNTIARTLLRCFGPREWGGMLIRMLKDLQPLAADCAVPSAKRISKDVDQSSFLQAVCSWKEEEGLGTVIDATEGERTEARDRVGRKFRNSSGKVFPFDTKGSSSVKAYCQAIKSRYEALFDILRGAALLNPVELCSETRFKEYRKEGQANDSKHQKK